MTDDANREGDQRDRRARLAAAVRHVAHTGSANISGLDKFLEARREQRRDRPAEGTSDTNQADHVTSSFLPVPGGADID